MGPKMYIVWQRFFLNNLFNSSLLKFSNENKKSRNEQLNVTYSKSPSVNGGCRFSRGKSVTNGTPIFISASVTSAMLGTHTLNCWLPFFTEEQENIYYTFQQLGVMKQEIIVGKKKDTDRSDKQQCKQCHRQPVVSFQRSSSQCELTSSDVINKEFTSKVGNLEKHH